MTLPLDGVRIKLFMIRQLQNKLTRFSNNTHDITITENHKEGGRI